MNNLIFVFGSNLYGYHGAGAAKFALEYHGAIMGQGIGLQGNSYAIPTKDNGMRTLPISDIDRYIAHFNRFTLNRQDLIFNLTPVGTGFAGISKKTMSILFGKYKWESNLLLNRSWLWEKF